jgi:carboxyl-terminal processing protease
MLTFLSKKKAILSLSLLFLLNCSSVFTDDGDKQVKQMTMVLQSLKEQHFQVPPIDDNFSKKVFKLYLDQLDHSKRFFTKEDSIALLVHKDKIDDQLNARKYDFFEKVNEIYEKKLTLVSTSYKAYLASPIDFTKEEIIQLDPDKRSFAKDDARIERSVEEIHEVSGIGQYAI